MRRAAVKLQRWYISMHENCSRHACARSGVTPRYSLIRCKLPKTSHDERSDIRVGLKLKSEILKASRDRSFSPGHAAVLLYAHYNQRTSLVMLRPICSGPCVGAESSAQSDQIPTAPKWPPLRPSGAAASYASAARTDSRWTGHCEPLDEHANGRHS